MSKLSRGNASEVWSLDQLARSVFFRRKLREWSLLEIADDIEQVRGEDLIWTDLNIAEVAWNKVIHRGIRPVIVFAHPHVLQTIPGSVGYYRMLAMVSQKSMKQVGISLEQYEAGKPFVDTEKVREAVLHLNQIISALIAAEDQIDAREFTLWRGMAAGAQAQGAWQNSKGASAERLIRNLILRRLYERGFIDNVETALTRMHLPDDRTLIFADEPDIAIYRGSIPEVAIEIKGGIDRAGVLERLGAALKSLRRVRQMNPDAITLLVIHDAAMTYRVDQDLAINLDTVTAVFSLQAVIADEAQSKALFQWMQI
ncbi:MAG: XcyI family restriction endonuclease [Anaerolinea sp.]|nr:XcyI family restriction endonuclease [Anaerolinea sp.]